MSPQEEPLYAYERPRFRLVVYANRIDITERKLLATKTESLLLRNVASVEINPVGGRLIVRLNDQTVRAYTIGIDASAARDAIVTLLR